MFAEERRKKIVEVLKEEKRVIAKDLVEIFQVSIDTIRRDLSILEGKGLLKRTHGGAILPTKVRVHPPEKFTVRDIGVGDIYYNAVAKKAASYINENDTIYISAASTGYLMTRYLPRDINFTVITNSIIIADVLKFYDNIDLFIAGGKLNQKGFIVDANAVSFVKNLRLDIAFLSGSGISADFGLSNATFETATFQRAVAEVSNKTICLAPHPKIGKEGFLKVIDTRGFDIVITDWEAMKDEISKIEDLGVEVIVVEKVK